MGILSVILKNINLDDTNYEKDDLDAIILTILLAPDNKFEKREELKYDKRRINANSVLS